MAKKTTAVAKQNETANYLPILYDKARTEAALVSMRETMGNEVIRPWDLPRIHIPSGGETRWTFTDENGEEIKVETINGIIVHQQLVRSYWKEDFSDSGGGSPPDCYSPDCIQGHGDPGVTCADCEFSEFKTGKGGEGQACKQMNMLYILMPGQMLPSLVAITPGSLTNFKKFKTFLLTRAIGISSFEISLGLNTTKNKKGIKYSQVIPKIARRLDEDETMKIGEYIAKIRPFLSTIDLRDVTGEFAQGNGESGV